MSWDASTITTVPPAGIHLAAWSPCDRFIAIALGVWMMEVLDSVTLERLQILESPLKISAERSALTFSPDNRLLTCSSGPPEFSQDRQLFVVSWDLQTGGPASAIRWSVQHIVRETSITYSVGGKLVGVLCRYDDGPATIFICDVASAVCMYSCSLDIGIPLSNDIWTHGRSFRFATVNATLTTITIWEVEFTSGATPTEVETLHAPGDLGDGEHTWVRPLPPPHHSGDDEYTGAQLLPDPCRLALVFRDKVLVWDVRHSKYLLRYVAPGFDARMSFSSDGRFFACRTAGSDIYLWREAPAGYILHKVLSSCPVYSGPLLSRNGESIAVFSPMIRLWRTKTTTPPSSILAQVPQRTENFAMDFAPDGTFAVVAMQKDTTVTVLDLKSGAPRLTIDADMEVYGLGVIGNTVAVIGDWSVVTWNLPAGDCVPGRGMGPKDRSRTINLGSGQSSGPVIHASIDSRHVAIIGGGRIRSLYVYDASTGRRIGQGLSRQGVMPWFSPDGCNIWCAVALGVADIWKVSGQRGLESPWNSTPVRARTGLPLDRPEVGYPWGSSCGYLVTTDWWILGPDGKRLLMLPPRWRSDAMRRMWKERFLVLLHRGLLEPVILELLRLHYSHDSYWSSTLLRLLTPNPAIGYPGCRYPKRQIAGHQDVSTKGFFGT